MRQIHQAKFAGDHAGGQNAFNLLLLHLVGLQHIGDAIFQRVAQKLTIFHAFFRAHVVFTNIRDTTVCHKTHAGVSGAGIDGDVVSHGRSPRSIFLPVRSGQPSRCCRSFSCW